MTPFTETISGYFLSGNQYLTDAEGNNLALPLNLPNGTGSIVTAPPTRRANTPSHADIKFQPEKS